MGDQARRRVKDALARRSVALRGRADARYRAHRSSLASRAEVRRGSRKRGVIMAVAGLAGLGSMVQLVSSSVMAVNFSTVNSPFALYTNYLQGEQVAAYLNETSRQNGARLPVAELGVKTASLAGLCLIAVEELPNGLGSYSVVLTAGDPVPGSFSFQNSLPLTDPSYALPTGWVGGTDVWATHGAAPDEYIGALKGARKANAVRASDLFLNAQRLAGAGYRVSGMYLGERAQDVGPNSGVVWETPVPEGAPAPPTSGGGFGLRVEHLNLAGGGLASSTGTGAAYGLRLKGSIILPKLKIQIVSGAKTQAYCPTAAG